MKFTLALLALAVGAVGAAYDRFVDELQRVNDRLKADPQVLARSGDPFTHVAQLGKQVGLAACSTD